MLTTSNHTSARPAQPQQIDPRGPRFGAAITTAVLALILILGPASGLALALLAIQTLAFATGVVLGLSAQPYGWLFRRFIRPRLSPPNELEDEAPPRFAQAVGLVFALAGAVGLLTSLSAVFYVAIGAALAAAFLNAAFNFCLGCEMYLIARRLGMGTKVQPAAEPSASARNGRTTESQNDRNRHDRTVHN
jgi:FtsH-binding integral membrane protein